MRTIFRHVRSGIDVPAQKFSNALSRAWKQEDIKDSRVPPRGIKAITTCRLVDDLGNTVAVGHSFCAKMDSFCKETGRNVAELRAITTLELSSSTPLDSQFTDSRKKAIWGAISEKVAARKAKKAERIRIRNEYKAKYA